VLLADFRFKPVVLIDHIGRGLRRADEAGRVAALSKEARRAEMAADRTVEARMGRVAALASRYKTVGVGALVSGALASGALGEAGTSTTVVGGIIAAQSVGAFFVSRNEGAVWRSPAERDMHARLAAQSQAHDPAMVERAVQEIVASIDRSDRTSESRGWARADIRVAADKVLAAARDVG
jgi:hypothetical protein